MIILKFCMSTLHCHAWIRNSETARRLECTQYGSELNMNIAPVNKIDIYVLCL